MDFQIQSRSRIAAGIHICSRWCNAGRSVLKSIRTVATKFGVPCSSSASIAAPSTQKTKNTEGTQTPFIERGARTSRTLWIKSCPAWISKIPTRYWFHRRQKVLQTAVYACLSGTKEVRASRMTKQERIVILVCVFCMGTLRNIEDDCRCTK